MQIDEYRKLAEVEDAMWYFKALNQRMLLPLKDWRGKAAEVLDAGCGTGGLIRFLQHSEPDWSITGLDYSELACSLARERTDARIQKGSITDLPFPDEHFDIVVCADVISQVEDASKALSEFARVVKPGGMVVINVAAYMWMWSYHDDTCETKHRFRKSKLLQIIRACGLTPVLATYANMFIFPFVIARRKIFPPVSPTSDVRSYSPLVENLFGTFAKLEYQLISDGRNLPTGSSVFIAARNPEQAKA
jgi:ubiquinone/menaquinone biosynthesis C-methylase UbiE